MPGLEDLLGTGTNGDQKITENSKQINPLEAKPDDSVTGTEENPLERMDEISKSKKDSKKKDKEDKTLDSATIEDMLMTGENTRGMFEPDNKEPEGNEPKLNEEVNEKAKRNLDKAEVKPSEKYADRFKNDLLKHPEAYTVQTPEGEMTIAEAIKRGYNPITKRFEKEHNQQNIKESFLNRLNDSDRTNIERITDPSAAQVAPADAEKYGLDASSPMVRQQPQQQMAPQPMQPAGQPAGQPQGMMPTGQQMPGSEESMAAGANPLAALLGGGNQ